jgi:hypothetical protein
LYTNNNINGEKYIFQPPSRSSLFIRKEDQICLKQQQIDEDN